MQREQEHSLPGRFLQIADFIQICLVEITEQHLLAS